MLYKNIAKIKIGAVISVIVVSLYIFIGNLAVKNDSNEFVKTFFAGVPKINFGLDLQGGSQLMLAVDFKPFMQEKYMLIADEIKTSLRRLHIQHSEVKIDDAEDQIRIATPSKVDVSTYKEIKTTLKNIDGNLQVDIDDLQIVAYYSREYIADLENKVIEKSLKIVRRRIDDSGTKEISLQRSGTNKILLQVPGVDDPERIKRLLGKTAKLSFHLMDKEEPFSSTPYDYVEDGMVIMRDFSIRRQGYYKLNKKPEITGEMLLDARAETNNFKPSITFRLNDIGGKKFAAITRENVGRPFAIVLDGKILTAPVINEPIVGGGGVISGSFTMQEARELSDMLRSGSLPVPLKVVEERTIGPAVGSDAIKIAKFASVIGVGLVIGFMLLCYRKLGIVAACAVILNLTTAVMVIALLQVTLTLSGIAGLILTLGMSVDANVLIYERMRDEILSGVKQNSIIVTQGFKGAWSAIVDSNITTILSAITLVAFGSGFIRGFAISLIIGILTSMFSAVVFSKLVIEMLFVKRKEVIRI